MPIADLALYSYWRSSASWRVRIGLHLKGLSHTIVPVHLLEGGGQQHSAGYAALNPQHLVPTLRHGSQILHQSLAILEYLDEIWPEPALLPAAPGERAQVRALAQTIACDIHPLNNLRILQYLDSGLQQPQSVRNDWARHWIHSGFSALETLLDTSASAGQFCSGSTPGLADCCLIPQVYNARRFGVELTAYPRITRIEAACLVLPAFRDTAPEQQPDAPSS